MSIRNLSPSASTHYSSISYNSPKDVKENAEYEASLENAVAYGAPEGKCHDAIEQTMAYSGAGIGLVGGLIGGGYAGHKIAGIDVYAEVALGTAAIGAAVGVGVGAFSGYGASILLNGVIEKCTKSSVTQKNS